MSVKVELRITVSNEGEVRVYGPIRDKILCYGLLSVAKDIIKDYKAEEQSNIVAPVLTLMAKTE